MLRHFIEVAAPGQRVLNVGAGQGTFSILLEREGFDVTSSDLSHIACNVLTERVSGPVVHADAAALPFPDGAFDAVIAGEVLEHLEDDSSALSEFSRVLVPGGVLTVSVPAHPSWFGRSDTWAGHRRRYEKRGLEALLVASGFLAVRVVPWGFPVAAAYHRFLYDRRAPRLASLRTSTRGLANAKRLLGVLLLLDRAFVGVERGCLGFIALARTDSHGAVGSANRISGLLPG